MAGKGKSKLPTSPGGVALAIGKEVVGESIEGITRVAAASITSVGSMVSGALQGAGSALGGALQGALTPAPTTIINNIGMTGQAAKAKVTYSGGTLPAPKKSAKPAVNAQMPAEKLLTIAVKYLSSIDKTLQDQINFERLSIEKQAQAEKEAAIEATKGPDAFATLGNKLGAISEDNSKKQSDQASSLATTLIKGTTLAGLGLGTLAALNTDVEKLGELKENISAFFVKFSWLDEMAVAVAGASAGAKSGGVRGALIGAVGAMALQYLLTDTRFAEYLTGNDARPNEQKRQGLFGGSILGDISDAIGLKYAYGLAKKGISSGWSKLKGMASWMWDTNFVKFIKTASTNPKTWNRFLTWMERNGGKLGAEVSARIAAIIAAEAVTTTAEGAAAATVVGAPVAVVVAVIDKVIAAGLGVWMLYDVYQLFKDFLEWDKANPEKATPQTQKAPNAIPVAGSTIAGGVVVANPSETGNPEKALSWFMSPEGGGYTKEQASGIVGNLFVESGLKTDAVGDGGQAYGIAQWHQDRQNNFRSVFGKDIRQSTFDEQLKFVTWELNNTEKKAGSMIRSATSASAAAAAVDQYYERSSGAALQNRISNAENISGGNFKDLQGGGGGSSNTLFNKAKEAGLEGLSTFGSFIKDLGKDIVGPRTFVPISKQTENAAKAISEYTSNIEKTVTFGKGKDLKKESSMSSMMKSLQTGSPEGKIELIDPNYAGKGTILDYLQYHKLATPTNNNAMAGMRA